MRILAFTDTHGRRSFFEAIARKARTADLLVCAGDISDWGEHINAGLTILDKIGKIILIIPGNHETENGLREAVSKFQSLRFIHKASFEIGNYIFFGYGLGGFSERDREFEKIAERFKQHIDANKKVILVTHGPPYGTSLDFLEHYGYRGCKSLRKFIEDVKPILHICGHLHDNSGNTDTIGKTVIVNPGPEGRLIDI